MRIRKGPQASDRIDYSRFSGKSHPVLEPIRGDVLRDQDVLSREMTDDDLAKAEAYRHKRLQLLLQPSKQR